MTRVLITGGSGFIGTNLLQYYRDRDCDVVNWDIRAPRNPAHQQYWQKVDILDVGGIKDALGLVNPDYIFHMAARTDLNGVDENSYIANTDGVRNIMLAAETVVNLRRIIFASSMLVCKIGYIPGNEWDVCPTTPYGKSKVVGERIVRKTSHRRLPWTIVRPTSIWGPWFDAPYKQFFEAILKGHYFHPAGVRTKRSYGYVGNAVRQLCRIASSEIELVQSKTLYLADYEPLELRRWAQLIQRAMKVRSIRDVPLVAFICAAKAGDLLEHLGVNSVPMTTFRLNNMRTDAVFDMKPLAAICGDMAYDADRAVRETVEWMKQFGGSTPREQS